MYSIARASRVAPFDVFRYPVQPMMQTTFNTIFSTVSDLVCCLLFFPGKIILSPFSTCYNIVLNSFFG